MPPFADRVETRSRTTGGAIVLGLDPIPASLPPELSPGAAPSAAALAASFVRLADGIMDAVADMVVAVKFQSAFYERLGRPGFDALLASLAAARERGLLTIMDVKRADIGSTAQAYADAYLGEGAETCGPLTDAVTVNPYLGEDGIVPFIEVAEASGKGVFVLVKTSNPSGPRFQDLPAGGVPLYARVAQLVSDLSSRLGGSCGLSGVGAVVGATYPAVLAELRAAMPRAILLLPGVGAQGGSVAALAPAFLPGRRGALITCSRSILYAYRERPGLSWKDAARAETTDLLGAVRALG